MSKNHLKMDTLHGSLIRLNKVHRKMAGYKFKAIEGISKGKTFTVLSADNKQVAGWSSTNDMASIVPSHITTSSLILSILNRNFLPSTFSRFRYLSFSFLSINAAAVRDSSIAGGSSSCWLGIWF